MPRRPAGDVVAHLTWPQALAWRLQRQHLADPLPGEATLEVARDLCGLHAQVMSSAELTVWARTQAPQRSAVQDALWKDRTLVKFWAMRGTLHLVRSDEFDLFTGALRTYDHYLKPQWLKYFGTTRPELETMLGAIHDALAGQKLTREELALAVEKETSSASLGENLRASWGSFLKPSSFRGHLCFAPNAGRNVRFTRPDTWIGPFDEPEADSALEELLRRFVRTYGPVTREDVARWWSGMSAAAVERRFVEMGDEMALVDVEGAVSWMLAEDVPAALEASPSKVVNLLPAFDQYVVTAPRNTPEVLDPAVKTRVYRKAAWLSQVLLADGRMTGVWKHERKGKRLDIVIEPFERVPAWVKKGAEREAERLQQFLGGDLSVRWADST